MGWDGNTRITNNTVNVPDLYDFIRAVQAYTGSRQFSLITHSLGVTLARKVLKDHPDLRADVVAFVGIAGGNHGTSFCPPGSEDQVVSCNEIAAGTQWLADLNGPDGSDETYEPIKWLTVYDGSGAGDPAYAGPTYAESPMLRGAVNRAYPGTYHNDLRIDAAIVADYRAFLDANAASIEAFRVRQRAAFVAERERWASLPPPPEVADAPLTTEDPMPPGALPVRAAVAGSVWQIAVREGQSVNKGDTLIVMEAMKMEIAVQAEAAGTVVAIHPKAGSGANAGDTLITLRPHARTA